MLRKLLVTASIALCAQLAHAAEAGKIIFVAGMAQVVDRPALQDAAVQEGELLTTGADGFIYIKTLDNGLFILRPNTRARIVTYHIDAKTPENTRIKLELLSGVARSKSGDAVKLARQNFRFNTPVAAIGVRGTDFTVFTDQDTSRVAVISGGIVVSGFAGACSREGAGPCEGMASRELSASQRGLLLQIQRGQGAPQLMSSANVGPDNIAPPRSDEPLAKSGSMNNAPAAIVVEPNLDAKKNESLAQAVVPRVPQEPVPPVVTPPPVVDPGGKPDPVLPPVLPPVVPPVIVPQKDSGILWGRWQSVGPSPTMIDLTEERSRSELLAVKGNFALFRTPGKEYVARENGSVGFSMAASDAYVYTDYGYGNRTTATASLSNGRLDVNFGSKTFATSFDLTSKDESFKFQAQGALSADGRLYGENANGRAGHMNVDGVLSNEKGGTAAYIFDGRIDARRTINGGTSWRIKNQ